VRSPAFLLILALSLILGAGCSGQLSAAPGSPEPLEGQAEDEFTPQQMAFRTSPTERGLFEMWHGVPVTVGANIEELLRVAPRPVRSFPLTDLPSGLSRDFDVRGWETRQGSVGFITTENRLALMLEVFDPVDEEFISQRVQTAIDLHGIPSHTIRTREVRYWFWSESGSRIMLCATPDHLGRLTLASALGNPALMTVLRMNPELAKADAQRGEELLEQRRKEVQEAEATIRRARTSE
jgi:hypothetical protein